MEKIDKQYEKYIKLMKQIKYDNELRDFDHFYTLVKQKNRKIPKKYVTSFWTTQVLGYFYERD